MDDRRSPSNKPRDVPLVVETTPTVSRNLLRGIRRYMSEHQNWSVILETGLRAPDWLPHWSGHNSFTNKGQLDLRQRLHLSGFCVSAESE